MPAELKGLFWSLWFEQLKQVAWLSAAGAGAALLLHERGLLTEVRSTIITLLAFGSSAVIAVFGQVKLVERLGRDGAIDRGLKAYLHVSLALLGAGAGALIAGLL